MPASFRGKTAAPASGFVLAGALPAGRRPCGIDAEQFYGSYSTGQALIGMFAQCAAQAACGQLSGCRLAGRRLVALRLNGCPPNCLRLRHEQAMPEAVVLCPGAAILLEKEEINGYFRLRLPARGAYKGPGRGKRAAEEPEKSPWIGRYNAHRGSRVGRLRSTALYLTAPLRGPGRYNA